MNGIEAYNASSTCACGGIPQLVEVDGKNQIRCSLCGCSGPLDSNPEIAVREWNLHVEALASRLSVTDIIARDNPKMGELMGKEPIRDPAPVIDAARACRNGLDGAWQRLMESIVEYDAA